MTHINGLIHPVGTEVRSLPCNLTDPDRLARGKEMAEQAEQAARLKEDAAGIAATARGHAKQAGALAHILYTGIEAREIPCEWRADYTARTKTCYRLDTGAPLETVALTAAEVQLTLDGMAPAPSSPPPPPTPITQAPRTGRARGRARGNLQAVPDAAPEASMAGHAPPMSIYHDYETHTGLEPAPTPATELTEPPPDHPHPKHESESTELTNPEG